MRGVIHPQQAHQREQSTSSVYMEFKSESCSPADDSGSPEMIEQWIELVLKKNSLVSEESDLMVA